MRKFQSYATYVRGLDREGPIPGLLTLDEEALKFESFEKSFWRWKTEAVTVVIPRAEIARITDLDGRSGRKLTAIARILLWLNVEPNGVTVEWGDRRIVFDCERPIDGLLMQLGKQESRKRQAV